MKFQAILHKGHWGNYANCADENGVVWGVDKKTGYLEKDNKIRYEDGKFFLII